MCLSGSFKYEAINCCLSRSMAMLVAAGTAFGFGIGLGFLVGRPLGHEFAHGPLVFGFMGHWLSPSIV